MSRPQAFAFLGSGLGWRRWRAGLRVRSVCFAGMLKVICDLGVPAAVPSDALPAPLSLTCAGRSSGMVFKATTTRQAQRQASECRLAKHDQAASQGQASLAGSAHSLTCARLALAPRLLPVLALLADAGHLGGRGGMCGEGRELT